MQAKGPQYGNPQAKLQGAAQRGRLLGLIEAYHEKHGDWPNGSDLVAGLGVESRTVAHHLGILMKEGKVKHSPFHGWRLA